MKKSVVIAVVAILAIVALGAGGYWYLYTADKEDGHELIPTYDTEDFLFPDNITLNTTIMGSLTNAGDYLVQHIEDDGKWEYQYQPTTDTLDSKYNILRHSGTTYSLALIFKYTQDLRYYNGSVNTINYLIDNWLFYENEGKANEFAYVKYRNDYAKLGGAALTILALTEIAAVDPRVDYDREIDALGNFIATMQYESGKFQCFYLEKESEHNDFYPGEALLALAKLYHYNQDQRYLDALESGLGYYNDHYKAARYTAYTPWATEAMVYAYEQFQNDSYLDMSYKMADSCLSSQIQPGVGVDPNHVGGWGSEPAANGASRVEGAVDAYMLAKRTGDTDKMEDLEPGIFLAGHFLMNLQFNETDVADYPSPERSLGGFPNSHTNSEVRIDAVQHSVVVLVKLMVYKTTTNYI